MSKEMIKTMCGSTECREMLWHCDWCGKRIESSAVGCPPFAPLGWVALGVSDFCSRRCMCDFVAQAPCGSVIVSPSLDMMVVELKRWLDHHGLWLSVSFTDHSYNAELLTPTGDGNSVVSISAKAAEFDVAVIAACENYEREHVKRTT